MYYNMNMYMKNRLIFVIFSFGISLCFMLNVFAVYIKNADTPLKTDSANGVVSKFFTVLNFSNDIVSSMVKSKTAAENKINNKNTQTKKNGVFDAALTGVSINPSGYNNFKTKICGHILTLKDSLLAQNLINYPLKIPFWRVIVFILLFRMLFNVLPRSISIRKNINCRKACALP